MPNFDIILTVWNRLGYTKRTIASLVASGAVDDCERLIIVDNRSTEDGMTEFLETIYQATPGVSHKIWLLRRGKNDGWANAVNDALGISRAPYLLLLNNDVEFTQDFHKKLLAAVSSPNKIGLAAGWKHTAHGYGVTEVRLPVPFKIDTGLSAPEEISPDSGSFTFKEMDNVPAVAWMLSKEAMQKVGMLDEKGPCFTKGGNGEDTDYVLRMKAAGYLVGALSEDVATHIDGY